MLLVCLHAVQPFTFQHIEIAGFQSVSIALSVSSKRKMITALPPQRSTKAYMYSTLICFAIQGLQDGGQTAGTVRHLNGNHFGLADGEALLLQHRLGLFHIIDNQAQDAEIGGVGQGKRPDVDAGLAENTGDFSQSAGLVFDEDGYLFNFHDVPPC